MKILIIYGTGEGQTRKIARYMENVLQEKNHQVVLVDAMEEPPASNDFDAVLIGSSVHMHRYQNSIRDYIMDNVDILNQKRTAFFSVSLSGASEIEEELKDADELAKKFIRSTGWKPQEINHIGGALKFTKYNFFKRLIMRLIASRKGEKIDVSKDYEYSNWKAVEHFVVHFIEN